MNCIDCDGNNWDERWSLRQWCVGNDDALSYFKHRQGNPLKYCVSKSHIIFTNTTKVPQLAGAQVPTNYEDKKYYSFINLKLVDTANYKYIFKVFQYKYSILMKNVLICQYFNTFEIQNVLKIQIHQYF